MGVLERGFQPTHHAPSGQDMHIQRVTDLLQVLKERWARGGCGRQTRCGAYSEEVPTRAAVPPRHATGPQEDREPDSDAGR